MTYVKDSIVNDGGSPGGDAILENMQDGIFAAHEPHLLATDWTDGTSGTGVALFTFTTAAGDALTAPISGTMYFSEVATGLTVDALDTGVTAAKGVINAVVAATAFHFVTNATGELDLTLTSTADSYWVVFSNPDGSLVISDEMAITGP